jgi:hypothetical protein
LRDPNPRTNLLRLILREHWTNDYIQRIIWVGATIAALLLPVCDYGILLSLFRPSSRETSRRRMNARGVFVLQGVPTCQRSRWAKTSKISARRSINWSGICASPHTSLVASLATQLVFSLCWASTFMAASSISRDRTSTPTPDERAGPLNGPSMQATYSAGANAAIKMAH